MSIFSFSCFGISFSANTNYMKWLGTVFFSIMVFQPAQAQLVFIDPPTLPSAQKPEGRNSLNFEFLRLRTPRVFSDQRWPQVLNQRLEEIKNVPYQSCQSEYSYDYALALTAQGKLEQCLQYVENCSTRRRNIDITTLIQGARCGKLTHQLQRTYDLLSRAHHSRGFNDEMASALTLEFALFAEYSIFPDQTDRIIARHPFWSAEERIYAKALIEFLGKTSPKAKTKDQIFSYLEQQISQTQGYYKNLLNTYKSTLLMGESRVAENHEHLSAVIPQLTNPLDWWPLAFQTQYRLTENADFSKTIRLYRAFLPYAHPRSYLPSEQNVYTYTQISQDVCKRKMLQGNDKQQLNEWLRQWKNGQLNLSQIINRIEQNINNSNPPSDLLSTYAGLLVIDGHLTQARDYYWRAHLACPYNNRSHWGLTLLERKNKYRAYPEYQKNIDDLNRLLLNTPFPTEIESYITNWHSFPEESKKRIKYGARIWAPFIKTLNDSNYKTYIKMPFELLSQAPGFASIRDARIGPPNMPNYKLDNRLWDDVRGAGGQFVISDHDETFETVHGDYNLLGHEIAHQFHAYLDRHRPQLSDCIESLYENAKQRKNFPDSYAATNSREYFAQGMTYFLIPADAPARYGINISWYPENDPDLYKLMRSIESSQGDFARISCPL